MREIWSLRLVALTGVLVVALCTAFACRQNPPESPAETASEPAAAAPEPEAAAEETAQDPVARGRQAYERRNCARCHSIAGQGSPRYPLDGVGSRLSAEEIRNWIIAPASLEGEMPASAFRAKQRFAELPAAEIEDLTAYLGSLE